MAVILVVQFSFLRYSDKIYIFRNYTTFDNDFVVI